MKEEWLEEIARTFPILSPDQAWKGLQGHLSRVFRIHGIQTAALLDPSTYTPPEQVENLALLLNDALKDTFAPEQRATAKEAISGFLESVGDHAERTRYIAQLGEGVFTYFSLTIEPNVAQHFRKKLNPLTLFFDTNFLFGILNLQTAKSYEASNELLRITEKYKLPFKLRYHPATWREMKTTIAYYGAQLRSGRASPVPSSIEMEYHRRNAATGIDVDTFLKPYEHVESLLISKNILLFRGQAERRREHAYFLQEYKKFLETRGRFKPDEMLEHDITILDAVHQLRTKAKSSLEAGALLITWDNFLYMFDWEISRAQGRPTCVVLPDQFIQVLHPFVPSDSDFDRSFAQAFTIPEFRAIDSKVSEAQRQFISYLNAYESLPEDIGARLLTNGLLIDRLQTVENDEPFQKTVESAMAHEHAMLLEEKAALEKLLERERAERLALEKQLELERSEAEKMKTRAEQAELLLRHQVIQAAQALYRSTPEGSEEQQLATQMLLQLIQHPDLSIERAIQVAQTLYNISPDPSAERQQTTQMLLGLLERPNIAIEQAVLVAQTIYKYSAPASKEWQQVTKLMTETTGLSTDELLKIVVVQSENKGQEPLAEHIRQVIQAEERMPTHDWDLHLELPSLPTIEVGQVLPLTLRFTADEQPGSSLLRIPLNALELAVYIEAPGFHLEGEQPRSIAVVDGRPVDLSLPIRMMPVASGDHTVRVLVYPGGRVEKLEPTIANRTISVTTAVTLPNIPELLDRRAIPNPEPDVILYLSLEEIGNSQQVQLHITCSALGLDREPLEPLSLSQSDIAWLHQTTIQAASDVANTVPSDVLASLRAIGTTLFDQLMPRNHRLRSLYWHISYLANSSSAPWSWLVVSDERAVLPWELICPCRLQGSTEVWHDDFLADQFVLAHWIGRQGLPLRVEAPLGWLALDHYHQRSLDLPNWHTILGDEELEGREDMAGHLALTQYGSPYYGLHVLRYTDAGQADRITYGGEEVPGARASENEAEAMLYQQRLDFTLRRPVVGLSLINGQPAGLGLRLSQRDTHLEAGWLLPFMHAGATALVGPRWPVLSEADQLFFRFFYQFIRTGSPLGWAVGAARAQVKQTFSDRADWLAYTYFGHPWCQPYLVRPAQGFALFEVLDHPADAPFEAGQPYKFRASYRTEAPLWYGGQLQVQQAAIEGEGISVLIMPLTGEMPETYRLKSVAAGYDYQCIVTLTMPQKETTLPVLVRFQKDAQELHTLILNLDVLEKKGTRI